MLKDISLREFTYGVERGINNDTNLKDYKHIKKFMDPKVFKAMKEVETFLLTSNPKEDLNFFNGSLGKLPIGHLEGYMGDIYQMCRDHANNTIYKDTL